ncbi:MAG: cupin domain-containing protein [Clostridia bacterium]|nr:cupin domain-containing protein [Clostridia bacterium]
MTQQQISALAERFRLDPHVEGGSFRELYRDTPDGTPRPRQAHGVIYYMLDQGEMSDFHVLDSDEYWMYHAGSTIELWSVMPDGSMKKDLLGLTEGAEPVALLKAGVIFGARHLSPEDEGTLMSCVTVPEFSYEHYRILPKEEMLRTYPASEPFFAAEADKK